MTPVEPQVFEGSRLVVFAEDQPDYLPLPVTVDVQGIVTSEWEPTAEELRRLFCGGHIRLRVHTFDPDIGQPGHNLQPVSLEATEPECEMRES